MASALIRCFAGLAWIALALGCASPAGTFTSTRDPAYKARLARVLIVYHNQDASAPDLGQHFSDAFLGRLTELLTARGVDVECVRSPGGSANENGPVREATERFRPRQMLHFAPTRVDNKHQVRRTGLNSLPEYRHDTSASFECILADYRRPQPVWRSTVRYALVPDPAVIAEQLVARLTQELLLDPPDPPDPPSRSR